MKRTCAGVTQNWPLDGQLELISGVSVSREHARSTPFQSEIALEPGVCEEPLERRLGGT